MSLPELPACEETQTGGGGGARGGGSGGAGAPPHLRRSTEELPASVSNSFSSRASK